MSVVHIGPAAVTTCKFGPRHVHNRPENFVECKEMCEAYKTSQKLLCVCIEYKIQENAEYVRKINLGRVRNVFTAENDASINEGSVKIVMDGYHWQVRSNGSIRSLPLEDVGRANLVFAGQWVFPDVLHVTFYDTGDEIRTFMEDEGIKIPDGVHA